MGRDDRSLVLLAVAAWATRRRRPTMRWRARARHFEAGRALYNLGNYTDAIREFSAGYQLAPEPQFLLNLGQCYSQARAMLEHARDMYQRSSRRAAERSRAAQVEQIVADLEKQLAAQPPRAAAGSRPRPDAAPRRRRAGGGVTARPRRRREESWIARNWWIIPVGAVVVAGVSLGRLLTDAPTGPSRLGHLGCVASGSKSDARLSLACSRPAPSATQRFGKYPLVERLGRGGMAEVWKARDPRAGRLSAHAWWSSGSCRTSSRIRTSSQMFVAEARLSARLNHANIVQVYELGDVDGEYFIWRWSTCAGATW